jgi:protein tyrosine/serine phosphatase/endonuclease/exonuclease/phosphatase family metal-dependent hydrolase
MRIVVKSLLILLLFLVSNVSMMAQESEPITSEEISITEISEVQTTDEAGTIIEDCETTEVIDTEDDPEGFRFDDDYPKIKRFLKVSDTYYRGSHPNDEDFDHLSKLGIKTIIDFRLHKDKKYEKAKEKATEQGFNYFNIPLNPFKKPDDNKVQHFLEIVKDPKYQPVYVHCTYGEDRTGLMTALYRVNEQGWAFKDAYAEMKSMGYKSKLYRRLKTYLRDFAKDQILKADFEEVDTVLDADNFDHMTETRDDDAPKLEAIVIIEEDLPQTSAEEITSKLSYEELVDLSEDNEVNEDIQKEIDFILNTPIVDNSYSKGYIPENSNKILGPFIRVANWNIERGMNLEEIIAIFNDPPVLLERVDQENHKAFERVEKQIEILNKADILMLTEVDLGMPRTDYKNIAEEIAKKTGYNYAYAVEFIEIDPAHLGLEEYEWSEETLVFPDGLEVDKDKYKGLHGTAILSKYPLKNVRIFRLPEAYDWYNGEKERMIRFESLRRKFTHKFFKELIIREVRHGSRIALIADVNIPGLEEPVTLVSAHLENRTAAKNRKKQMKALLEYIEDTKNPVIIGGDFNTSLADAAPKSGSKSFLRRFLGLITFYDIYNLPMVPLKTGKSGIRVVRSKSDPTVKSIPLIGTNPERGLFKLMNKFKFSDGYGFDYRSTSGKYLSRHGNLANSNERQLKGFVPTYMFERPLYLGKFKLDWLFVKSYSKNSKKGDPYRMAPHFGATLFDLNYAFDDHLSDHAPLTVDLPLKEPPVLSKKERKEATKKIRHQKK